MTELTDFEKGTLDKSRRLGGWLGKNGWVRIPMIAFGLALGWFAPVLGIVLVITVVIYGVVLYGILKKVK